MAVQPAKPKAGAVAAKPTAKPAAALGFSFNNDSDEDDDTLSAVTMPKNAGYGVSTASVDAEQEYEDAMRAEAAKAPSTGAVGGGDDAQGGAAPCVHESAKKRRYVMKNEKAKKWCEFLVEGLEYAPECDELFQLSMEELTISSKKERVAMQTKLADESMSTIHKTMCIGKLKVDPSGSGSGPGMTNLMAVIPVEVPLHDHQLDDLVSRMKDYDPNTAIVMLVALDHDVVKRVYKVSSSNLPGIYNPNTHNGNKYRVPTKLEEHKDIDDNFAWIGLVENTKRAGKRTNEEAASSNKAVGKKAAKVAGGTSSSAATSAAPEDIAEKRGAGAGAVIDGDALFKAFTDKDLGFQYAKLQCAANEVFSVLRCSEGNWLLVKTLA